MRLVLLAAALSLVGAAATPAAAAEPRPSQAACDTAKLGARDLADCLRSAADKGDRDLRAAVERRSSRSTSVRA